MAEMVLGCVPLLRAAATLPPCMSGSNAVQVYISAFLDGEL
jgi:hypothetical protein